MAPRSPATSSALTSPLRPDTNLARAAKTRGVQIHGTYVVGPTLYVVAPSKPSPSRVKEAQIVASSIRADAAVHHDYIMKLVLLPVPSAALDASIERGKEMQREHQAWQQESMAKFKSDMAAKDAHTHDFCNYLLDQRDFVDRDGSTVALPSNWQPRMVGRKREFHLDERWELRSG